MAGIVKSGSDAGSGVQLETGGSKTEGVFSIESLWRIQIKSIRDQILSGARDYLEVANLAEHIGADYHGRFLIELIQNAEDPSRQTSYKSFWATLHAVDYRSYTNSGSGAQSRSAIY